MIYSIKGKISQKSENSLILESNNIGYQIFVSEFFSSKSAIDQEVQIWTFLSLKEETIELYGFEKEEELLFFKKLNSIPGIGPKSALNILSAIKISDLRKAIINEDYGILTKVSGVGKKTAERIVIELRGRVGELSISESGSSSDSEVIDALVNLGYPLKEARTLIRKIPENIKGAKERLKEALKNIHQQN